MVVFSLSSYKNQKDEHFLASNDTIQIGLCGPRSINVMVLMVKYGAIKMKFLPLKPEWSAKSVSVMSLHFNDSSLAIFMCHVQFQPFAIIVWPSSVVKHIGLNLTLARQY